MISFDHDTHHSTIIIDYDTVMIFCIDNYYIKKRISVLRNLLLLTSEIMCLLSSSFIRGSCLYSYTCIEIIFMETIAG